MELRLDGQPIVGQYKTFSTGSRGWYFSGKVMMNDPDTNELVKVQVTCNAVIVGSKPGSGAKSNGRTKARR